MSYDAWKTTDPNDDSERELALEARREAAFREYLEDGSLPDGRDAGDVDTAMLNRDPEVLDEIADEYDDEHLLLLAKRLRSVRRDVIRKMIEEGIK